MVGIYKITNLINHKAYIGQSLNIESRWKDHKSRAYNQQCEEYNRPLYASIRKYGLNNFTFEVLEECIDNNDLNEREQYWINYYDTFNAGYNLTPGGDSAIYHDRILLPVIDEIYEELMHGTLTQIEIANKYGVSQPMICNINTGICWYNKSFTYPLQSNRQKIYNYCIDCGNIITKKAIRCVHCASLQKQKIIQRPDREELKKLIRTETFISIGQKFNVSDNAIRKWCLSFKLPSKKSIINTYTDEEWAQI